MFENIGGKIKVVASVVAWIGIIGSIIAGLAIMVASEGEGFFIGVLVGGLGAFFSWIGSFTLYGYGTLIENSEMTVTLLRNQAYAKPQSAPAQPAQTMKNANTAKPPVHFGVRAANRYINCPKCNRTQLGNRDFCEHCGVPFVYDEEQKDQ